MAALCPAGTVDDPCSRGGKVYAKGLCARHYSRAYNQTPEQKAAHSAYNQTPERKAARRAYRQTPEYKAAVRARSQTPERKAAKSAYDQTPEQRAAQRAYSQTPERKDARRAHNQTPEQQGNGGHVVSAVAAVDDFDLCPTPLAAALLYAGLGCRVAPVRPGSKVPYIKGWQDRATDDKPTIRRWYEKYADAGVCIATGPGGPIGNLIVVDIDVVDKAGADTFKTLQDEHGKVPTVTAYTPSGGLHFYYIAPDNVEIRNDAGRRIGPGVDIRGAGGQVLAPPTERAEGSYRFAPGHAWWDIDPAPAPEWLLELLIDKPAPSQAVLARALSTDEAPAWVGEFNRSHSWADLLIGWTEAFTDSDDVTHWVRPGKSRRQGTSATTNYAGLDCLYVYTTSVAGLPSDRMYDKYGFVVHRDYRGDFKAAAEAFKPATPPVGRKVDAATGEIVDEAAGIHLPEAFWTARPALQHVRQAAHSRTCSADVTLHCVLARVAGALPYTLKLPAVVGTAAPLCYFHAAVGPAGSGKSSGAGVARELVAVPDYVADSLPVGSGEGMAEVLFDVVSELDDDGKATKVKRQVRHNAIVYIDEGEALTALGARHGSTTLSTYRSIWSGQTIGQTNASNERKRVVPGGSYTYGVTVALQPAIAGDLLADVAAGTPQRFAWSWSTDPSIPDDGPAWPGGLGWTIPPVIQSGQTMHVEPGVAAEIRAQHMAAVRGEIDPDPTEAHAMLLRLKVAGLLAILDGRLNVDSDDWRLAGIVSDTSRAVRKRVQAIVDDERAKAERMTSGRLARRAVETSQAVVGSLVEETAARVIRTVEAHPDEGIAEGGITRALSRRQRDVMREAVDLSVERGEIVLRIEPGQGSRERRRYFAGKGSK